ncbi:hypothetical protein SNEBB_007913 [Seison nebaliae]|nr:hypothetical protein SNEBB_007913 [Seison nebaliae]
MDLNPTFRNLQWQQKWNYLDKLFEKSDKATVGLLNPPNIGVCMTNSIIGMITSSAILMRLIEDKQKCKKLDLCKFIENIYNCIAKPVPKKIEHLDETVGDILRTGIIKVAENTPYVSKYGFCGDYLIFKTYSSGLELNENLNENLDEKFQRLAIKSKQSDPSDMVRWDTLLNDMFDVKSSVERGQNYEFIYYQELNMLNLHLHIRNPIKRTDNSQIRSDKTECFLLNNQRMEINGLKEDLSSLKAIPNLLQISLSGPHIFQFHPSTIDQMIRAFTDGFYFRKFLGKYDVANFPIYLVYQFHTIPQLKGNEPFTIHLPIGKTNILYRLRSIGIAIDEEMVVMYKELKPTPEKSARKNPLCIEELRHKIMESIKIKEPKVYDYLSKEQHQVVDRLKVICEWVVSYATDFFYEQQSRIHTMALIQRGNQWIFINDQFSIKIQNIEQFTSMLKGERISGVLFEKTEQADYNDE